MKSDYIELEKEFECAGFADLHITIGATVYSNGDVEGHEAYIGHPKARIYLTHLFSLVDLQSLNDEFRDEYFNQ